MAGMQELPALVTEVEKACVRAYMSDEGFEGNCDDGFTGHRAAYTEDGTPDPNAQFENVRVTWPDGKWTYEDGGSFPEGFDVTWDATILFSTCKTYVHQVFVPWVEGDVPEPSDFVPIRNTIRAAADRLNVSGTTIDGKGNKAEVVGGNVVTSTYAAYVHDELIQYNGEMIDTFDTNYASRVDEIFAGQFALTSILATMVAGEEETWRRTREEVVEFAKGSATAFNKYADGGSGSWKSVLEAASFITTAAGLVYPPAGAASTVIGLVSSFVPEEPEEPKPFLEGDSPDAIYKSFLLARSDVIERGYQREDALFTLAQRAIASRDEHPEYYDISRPKRLLNNDNGEYFAPGENLEVLTPHLRDIAARFELLADIQQQAADDLSQVLNEPIWKRHTYLPSSPYPTYVDLRAVVAHSLRNSQHEMHDVALRLVEVSYDFDATDTAVQAELDRATREVRKAGNKS